MFDLSEQWNISFAGCGFRSIYYVGALSCILERVPQLVHGASKFGGASSGCLVAAALAVGIPIEQLCFSILNLAKGARKHTLGVFHPTFRMLHTVRHSLLEKLPEDAHILATGRLYVSLTRLPDGENVLVSKFDSREELIQHYVDGALSNNMPLFEHRNTITMAPFSGESDICPREGTFNFFEASYGNVSIQVNTGNVYRVCTSFLPPTLEKLAGICQNGYMDALRFLKESDLLSVKNSPRSVALGKGWTEPPCCEHGKELANAEEARLRKMLQCNGRNPLQKHHIWLNHKVTDSLPASIRKVLCEACGYNYDTGSWWSQLPDFLPVKLIFYMLTLPLLPILLSLSFAVRDERVSMRINLKTEAKGPGKMLAEAVRRVSFCRETSSCTNMV
ncbi:hypothetical protein CRENBAI_001338 [Crenichthys baileyi]|uniref:PNPLA domain-containing protein n=1 Tax=Crenichthys baileyi TaxID=28760 RepID=A0AAV9QSZ6_9TELE